MGKNWAAWLLWDNLQLKLGDGALCHVGGVRSDVVLLQKHTIIIGHEYNISESLTIGVTAHSMHESVCCLNEIKRELEISQNTIRMNLRSTTRP